MRTVGVRETRERLSSLLDAVAAGEEIVILRNGKPAAKLTAPGVTSVQFTDRSALRKSLPATTESAATAVRLIRSEERY